eukprot:gene13243-15291_t
MIIDRTLDSMRQRCQMASRAGTGRLFMPDRSGWLSPLPCGGETLRLDPLVGDGGFSCRFLSPGLMVGIFDAKFRSKLLLSESDSRFYGFANLVLFAQDFLAGSGPARAQRGVVRDDIAPWELPAGERVAGVSLAQVGHDLGSLGQIWTCALHNADRSEMIADTTGRDGEIANALSQLLDPPPLSCASETFIRAKATELLCLLSEPRKTKLELMDIVSSVKAQISADLSAPLDIDALARRSGISSRHLTRLFKARTGVTLREYLRERRLNVAAELLSRTEVSVQDIADEVGFADAPQLCKQFRSRFGQTPVGYRRAEHALRSDPFFSTDRP